MQAECRAQASHRTNARQWGHSGHRGLEGKVAIPVPAPSAHAPNIYRMNEAVLDPTVEDPGDCHFIVTEEF